MVSRFGLAIIVALLTFSASGVSALVVLEPCTGFEQAGQEDRDCPPTCVTCGCCAQPIEPVAIVVTGSPAVPPAPIVASVPSLPESQPRDILHVPKTRA
jgi:hypothetical protein